MWYVVLQPKPVKDLSGQVCEICGDEIGQTVEGDLFVACNECGFPVCRPCYEYERREGSQNCPQCKTRYKRIKGTLLLSTLFHNITCMHALNIVKIKWLKCVHVCMIREPKGGRR